MTFHLIMPHSWGSRNVFLRPAHQAYSFTCLGTQWSVRFRNGKWPVT